MLTASFTDPQGIQHTDAVFHLRTAAHNNNSREVYELSTSDFTTINNPQATINNHITCSFYYWINQGAKDNGAAPYILANSQLMSTDFTFTPDASYDGLTLEQKCEKHLLDVVLPPMQGA